jgi:SAM-dependent methyltransferase
MSSGPDGWSAAGEEARRYWNERHASATFNDAPVDWLLGQRALLEGQPRGRALDIACGGGRNTLFLAELGFEVDALDISDVAVERVKRLARERELRVAVHRVDLSARPPFPRPPYDVVIDFFFLQRSLFPAILTSLAPGVLLLFETFVGARPLLPNSFGPRFGLARDELRRAFASLGLLHYDEVEIGSDARGRRTVARLAARAPATSAADSASTIGR